MRTLFEYLRPTDINDAVALKQKHGNSACYWAGGTDMTLHWKQEKYRPEYCIDLSYLPQLGDIELSPDRIRIGAKVTLRALERASGHPLLKSLARVARIMCTQQVRALATIGGNLCTASPAADLSPLLVAMGAEAVVYGPKGQRRVRIQEFFLGVNKVDLSEGELLQAVDVPLLGTATCAASYRRIDRTVVDIALVNSAAFVETNNSGLITGARVALGAVAPIILSVDEVTEQLVGRDISSISAKLIEELGEAAAATSRPITDVRASADYRRDMVAVMTRRALNDVISELGSRL